MRARVTRVERECRFLFRERARAIAEAQRGERGPVMRVGASRHEREVGLERGDRLAILPLR